MKVASMVAWKVVLLVLLKAAGKVAMSVVKRAASMVETRAALLV